MRQCSRRRSGVDCRDGPCAAGAVLEALEPRLLLSAGLLITEFMAANNGSVLDGDGNSPDWIEIHNPTAAAVSLDGWYLTERTSDLRRWPFPAGASINTGQYMVVFASDQNVDDYVDAGGNMHTNFALKAGGEYLALVIEEGGVPTVVHSYGPEYPTQLADISYGVADPVIAWDKFVDTGVEVSYHVPTAGEDATAWAVATFDDSSWTDTVTLDQSGVVITEISTGAARFVEVQNVVAAGVDTTGWQVMANNASGGINAVGAEAWALPAGGVGAGTVLYATDDAGDGGADFVWSAPIAWGLDGSGWAMIVDGTGEVMDFCAWGYTAAEIATIDISFGAFTGITVGEAWSGNGAAIGDPVGGSGGFVAFNDSVSGTGTHANATTYAANGDSSGPLKDIVAGAATPVTLTTTHTGTSFASSGSAPSSGTDAYNTFDGFVDFRSSLPGNSLEVVGGDDYTHTFTGLDTGDTVTYNFAGTAVRGRSSYRNRWSLFSLEGTGAGGFTVAHSTGVGVVVHDPLDPATPGPNQVAIWTGHNSASGQGYLANWTNIDPGPDGVFGVVSSQYTGPVPTSVNASGLADGSKGYGVAGLRLEEVSPLGPTIYLGRSGESDTGAAGDFVRSASGSPGAQNAELALPFVTALPATTGVGFSADQPAFDVNINTDVGDEMQGVNASLWARIEFQADMPAMFDTMTLKMKYDDGFIAYINGTEVARQNAPQAPAYDSPATGPHDDAQAVEFESFDVSGFLYLVNAGANVLGLHALNVGPADGDLLILPELIAENTFADLQYMTTPTPRFANIPGALGVVADTAFSVDRGFYDAPFDVEITTATPGADIYYTRDGSEPTSTNPSAVEYVGPIHVAGQTVLRAAAYKPGYIATNVDTQTYIFISDVLDQDGTDLPPHSNWGHAGPDWEMDPDIVSATPLIDSNAQPFDVADAMAAIPTFSLVTDWDNWFGGSGVGIYPSGESSERPVSMELIYPDGDEGFQINGSVQIVGGSSTGRWKSDKLSMRVKFKKPYGPSKLDFPVFGQDQADTFDTLVVDARLNFVWSYGGGSSPTYQRDHAQYTRDQFAADIQSALGGYGPRGIAVHLYLNGLYWGLHRLHDRPDEHFAAAYLGGDAEDYYVLKHNENKVVNPNPAENAAGAAAARNAYAEMMNVANAGLSTSTQYAAIRAHLDVPDFIDYMITNFYVGNQDWAHQNWYVSRNAVDPAGRWRYHSWDAEKGLQEPGVNVTGRDDGYGSPTWLHHKLADNAEYRLLFADHVHRHFFNDGVLTPGSAAAMYQSRTDEIDRAIVGESARWGDNQRSIPYTRDVEWIDERDRLLNDYIPDRSDRLIPHDEGSGFWPGQFRQAGLYPYVDAPSFNQHGGQVNSGFEVTLGSDAGTIYYTADGTDPRAFGGAITGTVYTPGQVVPLTEATRIQARVRSAGGQWSALNAATFYVYPPAAGELTVTELNYHPHDPTPEELAVDPTFTAGDFEFIEVLNTTGHTVDLLDVKFTNGVEFEFTPAGPATLPAQQRAVIVADIDAFEVRYGTGINVAGVFAGALENAGERVAMTHPLGQVLENFRYNDTGPWPGRADGGGSTLEIVDPAADHTLQANWRSSAEYGGSPGHQGAGPMGDVVINEVLTHTDDPLVDAIELHNTTGAPIDVGGWFLSDTGSNYAKFEIPSPTVIPAGAYAVFYEGHYVGSVLAVDPAVEFGGTGPEDFALNGWLGDDVWLLEADASGVMERFVDHVEFGAAVNGESFGLCPDSAGDPYPMAELTLGSANTGPRIGPVIISELVYYPSFFHENFLAGGAERFTEVLGNWVVSEGRYGASPAAAGADAIAIAGFAESLPDDFVLEADVRAAAAVGGYAANAAMIFDYHGPADFKFAIASVDDWLWKIGHRNAAGWVLDASRSAVIQADRNYDLKLRVAGSAATLLVDGTETISHDFGETLNDGDVGVGTSNSASSFGTVAVEPGAESDLEFIEIYNPTAEIVNLWERYFVDDDWAEYPWTVEGFDFTTGDTTGTSLAPGEVLVVVGFDQADAGKLAHFEAHYGLAGAGVRIVGPFDGKLNNGGETVRLRRPDVPPAENVDFVPYLLVDEVTYDDQPPWPTEPDTGSQSLNRTSAAAWGNAAASWVPAAPTPGSADLGPGEAPTGVDLADGTDTGADNADNITNLDNSPGRTMEFLVSGTITGATVTIYAGGTQIGSAAAAGTTTTVTTDGSHDLIDGTHLITATQQETDKPESDPSGPLGITIDTVAPTLAKWSSAATHGALGELLLEISDDGTFTEPRTGGIRMLVLEFSEEVDLSGASVDVVGNNDDDGPPMDLSDITVDLAGRDPIPPDFVFSDTAEISFTSPVPDVGLPDVARYLVHLDGVIADRAGNALTGDHDRIMTGLIGDMKGDHYVVDVRDLYWAWAYKNQSADDGPSQTRADMDLNGTIDVRDLYSAWGKKNNRAAFDDPVLSSALSSSALAAAVLPQPGAAQSAADPLDAFDATVRRTYPRDNATGLADPVPSSMETIDIPAVAPAAAGGSEQAAGRRTSSGAVALAAPGDALLGPDLAAGLADPLTGEAM